MDEYQKTFLMVRTSELKKMMPGLEAAAEAADSPDATACQLYRGAQAELNRRAELHKPKEQPKQPQKVISLLDMIKGMITPEPPIVIDDRPMWDAAIKKYKEGK